MVIDNGVVKAANNVKVGMVSYDVVNDPDTLLVDDVTNEFVQVVFISGQDENMNYLYINGVEADSAVNNAGDWCGGDGAGWGHFQGSNHGGFVSPAAGTAYDTYYNGYMAVQRKYDSALSSAQILQNYRAINVGGRDAENDSLFVDGVYDYTNGLITARDTAIELSSGAIVTIESSTSNLVFDLSGIAGIDDLRGNMSVEDSLTCRIADGNGDYADADATVVIYGDNTASPDTLSADEDFVTVFTPGSLLGNDERSLGGVTAWFEVDSGSVTADDLANQLWRNLGSIGSSRDVNIYHGELVAAVSGFGGIGSVWKDFHGYVADPAFDAMGNNIDLTLEFWFRPRFGYPHDQVILDMGGDGNGTSIVYEGLKNRILVTVDAGDQSNPDTLQEIYVPGISYEEFNHVVVVVYRDSNGSYDTAKAWLNNDPSASFSATHVSTHEHEVTGVNDFFGSNHAGVGHMSSSCARAREPASFKGELAMIRAYNQALTVEQMAASYEAMRVSIVSVSPATTALGADVTLETDGTVSYDATDLISDIAEGASAQDWFVYTVSNGGGGFNTVTADVTVAGIGSVYAVDDTATVSASAGDTSIAVLANDLGTSGATLIYSQEEPVANFLEDFTAGSSNGDTADFRDGNGYGWHYMWNAPTGWDTGTFDASTGAIGSTNDYDLLVWDSALGVYAVNASGDIDDGPPGNLLELSPDSCFPGPSSTQDYEVTNSVSRYAIAAYTVSSAGYYAVVNGYINKYNRYNGPVDIRISVNDGAALLAKSARAASTLLFDCSLGYLNAGDTIYVAAGPGADNVNDYFKWDFSIVETPDELFDPFSIFGDVSVTGNTLYYNPAGMFTGLAQGESVTETISYMFDENGTQRFAEVEITVTGVNGTPTGVVDVVSASEDDVTIGSLTANDLDPDHSDCCFLGISEVDGDAGKVGSEITTPLGAKLTINADGSFEYDPDGAFNAMSIGDSVQESFTTLTVDPQGQVAPYPVSVTFTVDGENDGVIATSNHYEVVDGKVVSGNLVTDDSGAGVDISIDTNDTITVSSVNTNSTLGVVTIDTIKLVGTRGKISALNHEPQVVTFDSVGGRFTNPVVFAGPFSRFDDEPSWLVITNVDAAAGTFVAAIQEQPETAVVHDNDGNVHSNEVCRWMVFEKGVHTLLDGRRFEVGTAEVSAHRYNNGAAGSWQDVTFSSAFDEVPVVLHQLQTRNYDVELLGTRMEGDPSYTATTTGFKVALEEYAGGTDVRGTQPETVGWLAMEPGSGEWNGVLYEAVVTGPIADGYSASEPNSQYYLQNYGGTPSIVGSLANYDGSDPTVLRYSGINNLLINLVGEEQTIQDAEQGHAQEQVTYLAIAGETGEMYAYPGDANPDGSFSYTTTDAITPAPGQTIVDSFSYTITDEYGSTDTREVTIRVYNKDHFNGSLILVK